MRHFLVLFTGCEFSWGGFALVGTGCGPFQVRHTLKKLGNTVNKLGNTLNKLGNTLNKLGSAMGKLGNTLK